MKNNYESMLINHYCLLQKERDAIETRELIAENRKTIAHSICGCIKKLWRISWWKILFLFNKKSIKDKDKRN